MDITQLDASRGADLAMLFQTTFTASEGADEGAVLGNLVTALAAGIDQNRIYSFGAQQQQELIAGVFFTEMDAASEHGPIMLYLLSPMAVRTDHQGKGVGQALINHALAQLRQHGTDVVVTYGDPAYYSRVGFQPIKETLIKAPHILTMPEGWLAQSLTSKPIPTISTPPVCVKPFDNPDLW